jgi:hypothetical protein
MDNKAQSKRHRAALAALLQSVKAADKAGASVAKFGEAARKAGVTRDEFVAALQKMWGMSKLRVGSKNYRAIVARVSYWTLQAGYEKRRADSKRDVVAVRVPNGAVVAVMELLANQFGVENIAAVLSKIAVEAKSYEIA